MDTSIEQQVAELRQMLTTSEKDLIADHGEEAGLAILDQGGSTELARAIVQMAPARISQEAIDEFLRRNGAG